MTGQLNGDGCDLPRSFAERIVVATETGVLAKLSAVLVFKCTCMAGFFGVAVGQSSDAPTVQNPPLLIL